MAEIDNTAAARPTKEASRVQAIANRRDRIDNNLGCAIAIVDCVRVLAALERSRREHGETANKLAMGEGFANGDTVMDASMSMALYHAIELMTDTQSLVEQEM